MQVRNNLQSPNFGMAMKISKGARKALQDCSLETLQKLEKAGNDLKDTKFYHVNVDDNLCCNLERSKNAYWGPFKSENTYSVYLTEHNVQRKDALIFRIPNSDAFDVGVTKVSSGTDAKPVFEIWGWDSNYNRPEDILSIANVAKVLDEVSTNLQDGIMKIVNGVAVKKLGGASVETLSEAERQTQVTKTINNLLDTFGV